MAGPGKEWKKPKNDVFFSVAASLGRGGRAPRLNLGRPHAAIVAVAAAAGAGTAAAGGGGGMLVLVLVTALVL